MRKSGSETLLAALCCAALFLLPTVVTGSEAAPAAGVYLIFDASGSMWGELPDKSRKVTVAKQVLQDFVAGDFAGKELALRVYGHRREGDCRDSELLVPFGPPGQAIDALKGAIEGIRPLGKTPISYSLRQALEDFGDRSGDIILISDGIETCDEDPCALVREWRARDIGISVHVVGLGLEEKAKGAMRCIAEAAGTEYQDADSGATLAAGLSKIQEQTTAASLFLVGTDSAGERLRIRGTIEDAEAETTAVASERRNVVASGEYTLTVGVETRNGNLYRPVSRRITVAPAGRTTVEVEVARPPSVRVRFLEEGQEQTGALVHVSQDDREVFTFRHIDEVFVDEGTYEFRSTPNAENELSVTAAIATGERKEIVFEMVKTVHVYVTMAASGSGIVFHQNYELLQGGGKRYRVHQTNGARVLPGTYDLRLPDRLTPYVHPGVVVTTEPEQSFEVTVPVGHVTVIYQRADGSRDDEDRCFIGQGPDGSGHYKRSGEGHPLVPGVYNVTGWSQKGDYDRVVFEIREGEETEVVLRANG